MNDTMTSAEVDAYVAAVRDALADLPVEDVDELISGMAADLGEFVAESGESLASRLGPPDRYAADLRAAAGLPDRAPEGWAWSGSRKRAGMLRRDAAMVSAALVERFPWLRDLQPVWWLVRGGVLGTAVAMFLRTEFFQLPPDGWLLGGVVGAVVSFVVGRRLRTASEGGASPSRRGSAVALVGNVLALLLLAPVLGILREQVAPTWSAEAAGAPVVGLQLDGALVQNLYVYGPDGARLDRTRIFDEQGRPLVVAESSAGLGGTPEGQQAPLTVFPVPYGPLTGWQVWQLQAWWQPPERIGALAPTPVATGPTARPGASSSPAPSPSGSPSGTPAPPPTPRSTPTR